MIFIQRSRLRRPISKIRMVLLMDAKIWMTSLIIMFAVRPTCVQDSLFKMSSESPVYWWDIALATCFRSQPVLNMYIEDNFQVTLWHHQWRHRHEKYFSGIIWDNLFISDVNLKLWLNWHQTMLGAYANKFEKSTLQSIWPSDIALE